MGEAEIDLELVRKVQRGNKAAYDLLVKKYQQRIIQAVLQYVKNHEDAMDVAQEAFIKAYRALSNFRGDSAFYTWLYRIAINTAKNHLTAQKSRPPRSDLDADEASAIGSRGRLAAREFFDYKTQALHLHSFFQNLVKRK